MAKHLPYRLFAILLAALLLLPGLSLGEENLLRNGSFEEINEDTPAFWSRDMWLRGGGESELTVSDEGRDGGTCVLVHNLITNDARFVQWVDVKPDTLYRLHGYVRAEGINPEEGNGASLSIIASYSEFPEVYDTQGEWVELESYIITAPQQTRIQVGARIGDYSADNKGRAWFDDLSLVQVDAVPLGFDTIKLLEYADLSGQTSSESETNAGTEAVQGFSGIALWLFCFAALLFGLHLLRIHGVPQGQSLIFVLMGLAVLIRLYLMATQPGYVNDQRTFMSWAQSMVIHGPGAFYESVDFCDYPPGYMLLLWGIGGLLRLFQIDQLTVAGRMVIKLLPFLFDMGAIYCIYRIGKRYLTEGRALLVAALYAFSPAVLIDGAVWGQVDGVVALGLLLTVYFAMDRRFLIALPVYILTVLMKPQALMAGPLGLFAIILMIVQEKDEDARKKHTLHAVYGLLIGLGGALLLLSPFLVTKDNWIEWIIEQYSGSLGGYQYATINAANIAYLAGGNWKPLTDTVFGVTYGTWGTLGTAFAVLSMMALYFVRGDETKLPLVGALTFVSIFLFGSMMHERYMFPALLLLLYAYIRKPDIRILVCFVGFSITLFLNCAFVLRDMHLPVGVGPLGGILAFCNMSLLGIGLFAVQDPNTYPLPTITPVPSDSTKRLEALKGTTPRGERVSMKDALLCGGLTIVYAIVAFVGLGNTASPQTYWNSTPGEVSTVTFDLGITHDFHMLYFLGISARDTKSFDVSFSDDGERFYDTAPARMRDGDCFKWLYLERATYDNLGNAVSWDEEEPLLCTARYVRISYEGSRAQIFEVGFRDMAGNLLPIESISGDYAGLDAGPELLVDEQHTVPEYPSYMNSFYFDEIYHGRTGYEHAHELPTYETTHPPLGKVLIMLAIKLFGMTPFGWRFAGTMMGVLMVPAMYCIGRLLFGRKRYAFLAAFLMSFDMMHLAQTRIATIDSYAVLCIILMYLFMFRYMKMSFFRDGFKTLWPLFWSGLFMGIGCASKWIGFYAGIGLAILFFWSLIARLMEWHAGTLAGDAVSEEVRERLSHVWRYVVGTLFACVGFFIIIPFAIYYASYIPYFAYEGGLTMERFISAQQSMFSYHAYLTESHAYQSAWYDWPLMLRPMWYYRGVYGLEEGQVSSIMALGNPAIWWLGAVCVLYTIYRYLKPHALGRQVEDHLPAMLLIAYFAQLVPWMFVSRAIFIYHYFGSLPFMMLAMVYAIRAFEKRHARIADKVLIGYMALVVATFIAFYPIATGVPVSRAWMDAINWLKNVNLPWWQFGGWLRY